MENDTNSNGSTPCSGSNSCATTPAKSSRGSTTLQRPAQEVQHIPWFIFDPDSTLVCYWTAAAAIATLYNTWMIALCIAFPEMRQENGPIYLWYLDIIFDFIYMADIIMQLRTAYLQDGIPVFDPAKIREQYTSQTRFVRDVICVLPIQAIIALAPDSVGWCKYFLCTAGAARLTKLLKFHVLYKFYDLAESFTSNPHLIRVLRLFLNLAIIIHWIACSYYLLSEYEGLGSNDWVYTNDTTQQRFSRKYIVCLYWSSMTLTTIGNTNSPETDLEYIFTGVIFLTGVFVFATVMGNVGDVISSMNANRQEFQARMDHIQMYLTHKKVPASLQLKIKKWAEYTWSRTKATDESRLLNMLPERLRAEVAVHVHLDNLKKVKIFEQCETGFLCELVLKLRSQVFSPGDYVCRVGETGREMFIINHGKVEVSVPSPATGRDVVVAVLSEGNYFGEISLLRLDGVQNRRTADVRSIGYSELLCLSRRDLMTALVEYPEAKSVLEAQAKKRMKTNLQAQRAFSVDTLLRSSQDSSSMDSGIAGHDVSEIKAMIEELKNANKAPGRTVWQLIARCEVLQVRLNDKEQEVEDHKQRIRELEQLLFSRHSRPRSDEHEAASDDSIHPSDTVTDSVKHLRPTGRVTKQYSQDEGRQIVKDSESKPVENGTGSEKMTIPTLRITKTSSQTSEDVEDYDENSVFKENNFIKTSKISNVSFENVNTHSCQSTSFSGHDIEETSVKETRVEFTPDTKGTFRDIVSDEARFRIFSQNIVNINPSMDYGFTDETSVDQEIFLGNYDQISFSASFRNEFSLNNSLDFNVHTIPEESEDDGDDTSTEPAAKVLRTQRHVPTDTNACISMVSSDVSIDPSRTEIQHTFHEIPGRCSPVTTKANKEHFTEKRDSPPSSSVSKMSHCPLQKLALDPFESEGAMNFLRMSSINSCFSDEADSRRNSWNWDSEGESDEDGTSSQDGTLS